MVVVMINEILDLISCLSSFFRFLDEEISSRNDVKNIRSELIDISNKIDDVIEKIEKLY